MTQQTEDSAEFETARASEDAAKEERAGDSLWEIIRTVIYALLIALVFRTLLFQPFSIPSGSMKPTLLIGDYLFVSKYSYGYSKYSLPFGSRIPDWAMEGRYFTFGAKPERGDVIVFRNPNDDTEDYIKRLIGLPGDRIRIVDGVIYVNDEPLKLEEAGVFVEELESKGRLGVCNEAYTSQGRSGQAFATCTKTRYIETLPEGVRHYVLDVEGMSIGADNRAEIRVPEGFFFFVGDNRDNSVDSRLSLGMVAEELLIGRAEFVLLSYEGAFWQFWTWRGDRFFKSID